MRIGGKCAHSLPLIAAGISQVQHLIVCQPRSATPPRDDLVQLYRAAGLTAIPTIAAVSGLHEVLARGDELLDDPQVGSFVTPLLRLWAGYGQSPDEERIAVVAWAMEILRSAVATLHGGGFGIATGTDIPMVPGAIHLELEEMVASGLTPMEAIVAATSAAARVLGAEEEIGTVAEGKRADLILLDADPLEDIRNTRRIWKIIQDGRVVDREALLEWARENGNMRAGARARDVSQRATPD